MIDSSGLLPNAGYALRGGFVLRVCLVISYVLTGFLLRGVVMA
jgi:hypothetical protein